jgi:hypothetical protein
MMSTFESILADDNDVGHQKYTDDIVSLVL